MPEPVREDMCAASGCPRLH